MGHHPPPPKIPGTKAEGQLLYHLRDEVKELLSRETSRFPGAQPVSFAARHIQELQQQDYYVCEKSDGIRCLMYLTEDSGREITYLIDRKNEYYFVDSLHFPTPESEQSFHVATLVDGELVNDREPSGGTQLKYLVFDCLILSSQKLLHRTLDKRLAHFRDKIFNPYHALYAKYPEEKEFLPFLVEFKKMERAYGIEMMFRSILPSLPHGNDGLIFTCRNTPYKFGTDPHILKWKPANENSIDFRLVLDIPECDPDSEDEARGLTIPYKDYSVMPGFLLYVQGNGRETHWGTMHVETTDWESIKALEKPLDDSIVECNQDDQHRWRFMRIREDKYEPNHVSTVESVIESIQDRIEATHLIDVSGKIRDAWKARNPEEGGALRKVSATTPTNPSVSATNGANGIYRDISTGQKRKLANGIGTDVDGISKRRITPQPSSGPTG